MLFLHCATDTLDFMRKFRGTVLSVATLEAKDRHKYFVREADVDDIIVDALVCHLYGGRIDFRQYKPERDWYSGNHFEGRHGPLSFRIGFQNGPVAKAFFIEVWEDGRLIYATDRPQEMMQKLHQAVEENVLGMSRVPAVEAAANEEDRLAIEHIRSVLGSPP